MYDILIIGAGVNGASAARELSKYKLKIAVLERCSDVCEGTSKANSGIAHAGYDAMPGTLKAKLNVRGSLMMEELSKKLGFMYRKCGSMVLCLEKENEDRLYELKDRADKNGVKDVRIISGEEARKMEPNLSPKVTAALYAPTGAIVDPFGLNIALAENACDNGVEFCFNSEVTDIERTGDGYRLLVKNVITQKETYYESKTVINAAGVYADRIHNMVSDEKIDIMARKGEYLLLDNTVGDYTKRTVFQLPGAFGKGILVTPTVHGNILVGPTAADTDDKEDVGTTAEGINTVKTKSILSMPDLPLKEVITSFSGLRARLVKRAKVSNFEETDMDGDFMLGEVTDAPGFIDMAGMESPGLTCAPAAGEYVSKLVGRIIELEKKDDFIDSRAPIKSIVMSSDEEKMELIAADERYSNIVCRCCSVSEGEIVDAIHRTLGATTADGVKRRVGAGMGRCQSGFCNPKVVEILSRELKVSPESICKNDPGSEYLISSGGKSDDI